MADEVSSRILTAVTLAEQAAAKGPIVATTSVGAALLAQNPLIAASSPSHWVAVAELLRAVCNLHTPMKPPRESSCSECYRGVVPCDSLAALLPLVDQIIRDLGEK